MKENGLKRIDENTISLCGNCGGCPTLSQTADGFAITDDFGGKVALTAEQLALLQNAIPEFLGAE